MSKTIKLLFLTVFATYPASSYAKGDERLAQLESQVAALTTRIEAMEANFKQVKKGGFTIVPVVSCELTTPVNGSFTATELTKPAALTLVIEKCKEKASNKNDCAANRVVCK
ncbi:MAG: hypothetical protein IT287_00305 [Bdellovibrionaceae bacterium]|nr:hypothetical protein [Pseudobdellovibrionaceae bacterium]